MMNTKNVAQELGQHERKQYMKNMNGHNMIQTISLIGLIFALSATLWAGDEAASYSGPKEKLHVYLLIGQSNMAGRAPYTEEETKPIDRCFLLNDKDQWGPAQNPLNIFSTIRKEASAQKMSPGFLFAKTMVDADKSVFIGLVVNSRGGSNIEQWAKGTKFYNEIVRRAREAQKTGTLKGILWHQGESNLNKPDGYLDKLKALIENLRKDLGAPDLPFVAGQINDGKAINDQIAKLPEAVPNTGFVSSEGLKAMDRWHFDAASMRILGQRYAEAMLKLLEPAKKK